MKKKRSIFAFAALIIFCSFVCGCGNPVIYSKRFDHEINIDEKINELKDTLVHYYYDENTRVNIGIGNDDTYLYLCLLTRNHGLIEQLDNAGFTVWFDPKGGKNKVLGIRLFTGIQDDTAQQGGIPPNRNSSTATASMVKKIEITGPGKKEHYTANLEVAKKYGVTIKTGDLDEYFVYELKVPLVESKQHHYAIGVGKNKIISIGLESAGFGRGMPPGMGPGGGGMGVIGDGMMRFSPSGGMGGPGGGGPGGGGPGGGGSGRGGMPEGNEGLQLWLTVVLS